MTSPRLAGEAVALIEAAGGVLHYMEPYPTAEAIGALAARLGAIAILSRQGPVTAATMDRVPSLRIVARHGVGVDDVDVAEAARRGILVTRSPGSNTRAVAEHTLALILALVKDLPQQSAAVAASGWRDAATQVGDVAGLRLGLLGYGDIGRAVGRLAAAFDMDIMVLTRRGGAEGVATARDLPHLLARSDVLSLHLPMNPSNRHIIGPAALAQLPVGAFVINTSRGGLIDEPALLDALNAGHIAGAGLDVFEQEPPRADDTLRRHPRVIVTPHVAGVTAGSMVAMGVMAAECIAAVLRGESPPPACVVTP